MESLNTMMAKASDFNTPEPERVQLVKNLARYPCSEVTGVLAKAAVVDISSSVRQAAVQALKEINPKEALEIFIRNAKHPNPTVILNVIRALGQLGYVNRNKTIQALAVSGFLTHRDRRVRVLATLTVQKLAGATTKPRPRPKEQPRPQLEIVSPAPAFH